MSLPLGEDCNQVIDQGEIPPFYKVPQFCTDQRVKNFCNFLLDENYISHSFLMITLRAAGLGGLAWIL